MFYQPENTAVCELHHRSEVILRYRNAVHRVIGEVAVDQRCEALPRLEESGIRVGDASNVGIIKPDTLACRVEFVPGA